METTIVKAYGTEAADAPIHSMEIRRRALLQNDVEIDILYCGICHSDLHAVKNDWGGTTYPIVPGHEIVGRITQIGKEVTRFKVGDEALERLEKGDVKYRFVIDIAGSKKQV